MAGLSCIARKRMVDGLLEGIPAAICRMRLLYCVWVLPIQSQKQYDTIVSTYLIAFEDVEH